jgi:hypothetical protein
MAREWTFRLSNATVMPEKHQDFPQEWIDRHRLQAAIVMAPEMLAATLEQLGLLRKELAQQAVNGANKLYPWRQTSGPGQVSPWIATGRREDTIRALAKYFAMQPKDPDYLSNLDKIIEVYEKVAAGLSGSFEIVVFRPVARKDSAGASKPTTARGFVNTQKPVDEQFLEMKRELISMGDSGPHKPFGKLGAGKIHLSLSLFVDGGHENGAEAIARTLVHEASHKFASTKDHLYKHQSFIGLLEDEKVAEGFEAFGLKPSDVTKGGHTYKFGKPVARGPVMPMHGFKGETLVSSANKFIENADSYAWAARRIWKRYR